LDNEIKELQPEIVFIQGISESSTVKAWKQGSLYILYFSIYYPDKATGEEVNFSVLYSKKESAIKRFDKALDEFCNKYSGKIVICDDITKDEMNHPFINYTTRVGGYVQRTYFAYGQPDNRYFEVITSGNTIDLSHTYEQWIVWLVSLRKAEDKKDLFMQERRKYVTEIIIPDLAKKIGLKTHFGKIGR
jgi:hypothetical protein